ncbi:sugar phosphate isomerase/epimerase [Anseongella ginsenosidimutans]|uniref:Sugar phosphate isomerase/epimerase n=1 Tax=Anseongella ginsenosidimutans TaxID=496056 RepID=A0A4V2UTJ3_9SPHI|nr:sugar phosphate isomerase/epimerase [Anseongella ginsenosidimutans]QEC53978.1 sugar phosphate isomerase/epimerase [Anseongella ginsenosidimutans]TCS86364.1 sugar phosphate isomerase/epimerase [Anseongella ginsenosidimutans]
MKKAIATFCFILTLALSFHSLKAQNAAVEELGWKIGSQAYTFRLFTLEEALGKLNTLGLKYVELYPGQKVDAGSGDATVSHNASPETIQKIKQLLKSKGVQPVCYGVVSGGDEAEWRKIFEFAKELGIEIITSEPAFNQLDMVEKLCEEFKIKLAIHNHPLPSGYWHPQIIATLLKDRSPLMGACADIGHWVRSGLDPIESLHLLEGRVISFHIKDMNKFGVREAHDVPWGTGYSNISAVMHEMKRQNFKGVYSIEYEHNWENNVPEIQESLEYFYRVAEALTTE